MKSVLDILKDLGIEVAEDKHKQLNDAVIENYRTIKDYNDQVTKFDAEKTRADELNAQVADLSTKMKNLEGSEGDKETIEALNTKIKAFEDAEAARVEAEKEAASSKALLDGFNEAMKQHGELIPYVSEALFKEASALFEKDPLGGMVKAVAQVVEGKDGIFVNPQTTPGKQAVPGKGDVHANFTLEEVKAWSPDKINENWDAISKLMDAQS